MGVLCRKARGLPIIELFVGEILACAWLVSSMETTVHVMR
jgi:hypothetical protein